MRRLCKYTALVIVLNTSEVALMPPPGNGRTFILLICVLAQVLDDNYMRNTDVLHRFVSDTALPLSPNL